MGAMKNKLKGKAKEIEGRLTGDKVRTGQGKAEHGAGEIQERASRAANRVKREIRQARTRARARNARNG